tara:strand:+ start:263 stop:571 length:309 start_codon:yes stop_codon:yes gene_type:complete
MGVRENKVERYLDDHVKALGGITRKWVSPGVDGVPDRIVLIGKVFFCEVKTCDGGYGPGQLREHDRLREHGATVCTVWGEAGVDQLIEELQLYGRPTRRQYG